jgi:hypothetical protein
MPTRLPVANATSLLGLVTGPATSRRWWLRLLVRVTGGGLGLLLLLGGVVAYLLSLRPDIPAARKLARTELGVLLERSEQVTASAWVRRREWWDGFRETYGILALTDRRVLFVGIPPRELFTPERGPQQFVIMELGRDSRTTAERTRVDLGTAPGLYIGNDRGGYAFASADDAGIDRLLADVAQSGRAEASERRQARRRRAYETRVAEAEVWHRVDAGDALTTIADRYGTSAAEITRLNRLPGTTIRVGQRLLVRDAR